MNKLTKLGMTAVAGSLVASSAYAGALDVSGSAKMTYKSQDEDEVTGNQFSTSKGITFSGSCELDNGFTMNYTYTMTDAALSSTGVSIDMGDSGTFGIGNGQSGAGLIAYKSVIPTAGEEAWDDTDEDDNGVSSAKNLSDTNSLYYTGSFGGFGISAAYTAAGKADRSDNSAMLTYAGLVDGLEVGYGTGESGTSKDFTNYFAKYTVGSITAAIQMQEIDNAGSTADEESTGVGISIAVNENLSVSYGRLDVDMGASKEDEESSGVSASYTMGSMTISAIANATDSVAGTAGDDDTYREVTVAFAF